MKRQHDPQVYWFDILEAAFLGLEGKNYVKWRDTASFPAAYREES